MHQDSQVPTEHKFLQFPDGITASLFWCMPNICDNLNSYLIFTRQTFSCLNWRKNAQWDIHIQAVFFILCFRCKSHAKDPFSDPRKTKDVKNTKFSLAESSQQLYFRWGSNMCMKMVWSLRAFFSNCSLILWHSFKVLSLLFQTPASS